MTRFTWNRREWLVRTSAGFLATTHPSVWSSLAIHPVRGRPTGSSGSAIRVVRHAERIDASSVETLAQQAVEAAHAAGARYADVRLTREVQHEYEFHKRNGNLCGDVEFLGIGVRALVDGYWGFAASPIWTPEEAVRLAREAVAQARENTKGTPRTVELGEYPAATGRWATPVAIDPFTILVEEKIDHMQYWQTCLERLGLSIVTEYSNLLFARQERVVATSEGTCVTQTLYESGGVIIVQDKDKTRTKVQGIDVCAKGWELFLDAKIPEQIATLPAQLNAIRAIPTRPSVVGRYTLVCDGATVASLVEQTFGIATQLDRALGYEANAMGTSYLDDPLGMLGHLQVAASTITVTANRSAPTQLATVQWDDEGVTPVPCTLVKDGILTDFQTTREQAAWLAPYYMQQGRPVRSQGDALSEDALAIPLQQMPNLALQPAAADVKLNDLVADVREGILIRNGLAQTDQQARNGTLRIDAKYKLNIGREMRKITNGRLGARLSGGAVQFSAMDLWRHVAAIGGPSTQGGIAYTGHNFMTAYGEKFLGIGGKGEPVQLTSHSVSGVAAVIPNQPMIDIWRKA